MNEPKIDPTQLYTAILEGDHETAARITEAAIAENFDPEELVNKHMIPAMDEVGRRFENCEYYMPELLTAGRAMKSAFALIRPLLVKTGVEPTGRVVIGTVQGDLHDIGKGLVASMLEGGGYEVIDLGVDVPAEQFVRKAKETGADIVALSALLTTTMLSMKNVIDAFREAGIRDQLKVIIGGAPVTQEYTDSIGADGFCPSASGVVALARKIAAT